MQNVIPALRITDCEKSKAFYLQGLGFTLDWEHRFQPDFPVFMSITRDSLSIFLSQHSGDCQVGGLVYLFVDDVDAWRASISWEIAAPHPKDQPWGMREMRLKDPDGNTI